MRHSTAARSASTSCEETSRRTSPPIAARTAHRLPAPARSCRLRDHFTTQTKRLWLSYYNRTRPRLECDVFSWITLNVSDQAPFITHQCPRTLCRVHDNDQSSGRGGGGRSSHIYTERTSCRTLINAADPTRPAAATFFPSQKKGRCCRGRRRNHHRRRRHQIRSSRKT